MRGIGVVAVAYRYKGNAVLSGRCQVIIANVDFPAVGCGAQDVRLSYSRRDCQCNRSIVRGQGLRTFKNSEKRGDVRVPCDHVQIGLRAIFHKGFYVPRVPTGPLDVQCVTDIKGLFEVVLVSVRLNPVVFEIFFASSQPRHREQEQQNPRQAGHGGEQKGFQDGLCRAQGRFLVLICTAQRKMGCLRVKPDERDKTRGIYLARF